MPRVAPAERLQVAELAPGVYGMAARFGFGEEPDLTRALELAKDHGLDLDPMTTTFFVARSTVVDGPGGLPPWRCGLYAWMTRQAEGAASYFNLPPNRVVELGTQVML